MKTDVKIYVKKIPAATSLSYCVRCKLFLNDEEVYDKSIASGLSETEALYVVELLEEGKTLCEIHDLLHGKN